MRSPCCLLIQSFIHSSNPWKVLRKPLNESMNARVKPAAGRRRASRQSPCLQAGRAGHIWGNSKSSSLPPLCKHLLSTCCLLDTAHRVYSREEDRPYLCPGGTQSDGETGHLQGNKQTGRALLDAGNTEISRRTRSEAALSGQRRREPGSWASW